jgi:ferredoxin
MDGIEFWGLLTMGVLILLGGASFAVVSWREKERRAVRVSVTMAFLGGVGLFAFSLFPSPFALLAFLAILVLLVFLLVLFLWPIGQVEVGTVRPSSRIDERDIMFARARLREGSEEYESYYRIRPEKRETDDALRALPGILSPGGSLSDPIHFASADASFYLTEVVREAVNGPVASKPVVRDKSEISTFIKSLVKYYGALDVGITRLEPYHVYSHIGRGTGTYGAPIPLEHDFAIAFTTEMDRDLVAANPKSPVVMESARQYVQCAAVAIQLAQFLRNLGYPARAHIDGNYRVVAPLVARDAGLGEIGRMGLLMTPGLGPRVRIGVVTTTLELETDSYFPDASVLHFCKICTKCADCCPSRAIPSEAREEVDGVVRWRIDSESCFRFWCISGTDCARCMAVCPYSHPDTWSHNTVRWGIRKSGFFRRCAYRLDDLFYGRKPRSRPPNWTRL